MALDDNRISFGVDVSTGQSEESINKVIDRIDGLKDKINELKKLRTKNKKDADIFANYTKSIRDTERELSKLQSTYNSWIQKATNVDAKPIGDVKKQAQEFIALLKQWDGQATSFQKQVMSHFMIPNSAVDQLKLYKNIMGELQGYGNKKIIDADSATTALTQLATMAKNAQQAVDSLKASLKDTKTEASKKLTEEEEKISRIRQQLSSWNTNNGFASTIKGYDNLDSYSRQLQALRRTYEELNAIKGKEGIDNHQLEHAINSIKQNYDELIAKKKQVDAELKKGTEDVAKTEKQADATKKLAKEEENLSNIRKQLNSWDGKSPFSSSISGFENLDSYSRQIQALRRAYEELNAVKGQKGIDNAQVESAIDSVKRKYDELVAKKNQVDAELKKGTEDVAKASKKASDEESANVKKTIDEYTRLKLKMAEIQEQIKNNYITNKGINPEAYATNFAKLKKEYAEVSGAVKSAEREMSHLAIKTDFVGRAFDRLRLRAAWVLSALGANAFFAIGPAIGEATQGVEQSMASLAQVLPRSQQNLSAALDLYKSGVTDLNALKEAYDGTGHSVNAFGKSLHDMTAEDVQAGALLNTRDMEMFRNQLGQMQSALQNFAVKYGESYQDVARSATLWGRMYKDNNVILTMTDAAMKLAVADSFSIVEANKNLESSVAQWGFQIKNNNDAIIVSNKICDSWTAIAHNMAVSAQDLSAANQRAATSMHAMNVSFDVGQALIATMLRNTQQSGAEIGNAIKSIMGSIHSEKAIKDLQSWGVEVYKFGKDGQREFRNVGNVLVDLMIKAQGTNRSMEDLLKNLSGGKIAICPSLK